MITEVIFKPIVFELLANREQEMHNQCAKSMHIACKIDLMDKIRK
jgi:hypothetical protein